MTLAAMTAGDETADFDTSRDKVAEILNAPLPTAYAGRDLEESELRMAVGLVA